MKIIFAAVIGEGMKDGLASEYKVLVVDNRCKRRYEKISKVDVW